MTENCSNEINGFPHPLDELKGIAKDSGLSLEDLEFAKLMDAQDPLKHLRDEFHYPKMGDMLHSTYKLLQCLDC